MKETDVIGEVGKYPILMTEGFADYLLKRFPQLKDHPDDFYVILNASEYSVLIQLEKKDRYGD